MSLLKVHSLPLVQRWWWCSEVSLFPLISVMTIIPMMQMLVLRCLWWWVRLWSGITKLRRNEGCESECSLLGRSKQRAAKTQKDSSSHLQLLRKPTLIHTAPNSSIFLQHQDITEWLFWNPFIKRIWDQFFESRIWMATWSSSPDRSIIQFPDTNDGFSSASVKIQLTVVCCTHCLSWYYKTLEESKCKLRAVEGLMKKSWDDQ